MTAKRLCRQDNCWKSRQGSPYCQEHADASPDVPRCDYTGCGYARLSGGLCQRHKAQLRRGIELKPLVDWSQMPCRFRHCTNLAAGRGQYCTPHASQKHKGRPLTPLVSGQPCPYPTCTGTCSGWAGWCKPHVALDGHLKREYGIGLGDRVKLAEQQGHTCAICATAPGTPYADELHVDHCHATGKVRGLLCGPCNRALGLMQDNPVRLAAAARYVRA